MATKDSILEAALDLFSQHGYDGTSVREIARAAGIRESSLYNHFPGKRAIFDAIVDACLRRAEDYFRESGLPFGPGDDISVYRGVGLDRLQELIARTFRYFFDDPWNVRFRRLLLLSQFSDPRCRDIYRRLYRDKCVQVQSYIFSALMDAGELRRTDPEAAALAFHGPLFLLLHTCDSLEEARPAIEAHVEQFRRSFRPERPASQIEEEIP